MVKTAIKHYIWEACINMFFSGITNSFKPVSDGIPKVGERYSRVISQDKESTYYHCRIIAVSKLFNCNEYPYKYVFVDMEWDYFNYNGNIIYYDQQNHQSSKVTTLYQTFEK